MVKGALNTDNKVKQCNFNNNNCHFGLSRHTYVASAYTLS